MIPLFCFSQRDKHHQTYGGLKVQQRINMRKLILIIFLFIVVCGYSQRDKHRNSITSPYSKEALQYFSRLTELPPKIIMDSIDKSIRDMVANGVWAKLDALYIKMQINATDNLVNVKQNLYNAVPHGTATINPYMAASPYGFYESTGFIPNSAGGQFQQNSATLFTYIEDSITVIASYADMGTRAGLTQSALVSSAFASGGRTYYTINADSYARSFDTVGRAAGTRAQRGFWLTTRTASNVTELYRDGVLKATSTQASNGNTVQEIYIYSLNNSGSSSLSANHLYSFFGFGSGMTQTDVTNLKTALDRIRNVYISYRNKRMVVWISGNFLYMRNQYSATKDLITLCRWNNNIIQSSNVFNFSGTQIISLNVIGSTVGTSYTLKNEGDDICPVLTSNVGYIGGNHGLSSLGNFIKKTGHGKTSSDLGSQWSDGTNNWHLLRISSDTLFFLPRYISSGGSWNIPVISLPASGTMTHVAGAANTGSIAYTTRVAGVNLMGTEKTRSLSMTTAEGQSLLSGRYYVTEYVNVSDIYTIADPHTQGGIHPNSYTVTPTTSYNYGDAWFTINNQYKYSKFGLLSHQTFSLLGEMKIENYGFIQAISFLPATTGYTNIYQYMPRVKVTGGYDMKAIADMTTPPGSAVQWFSSDMVDISKPVNSFFQFSGNGGRTVAFAAGFIPDHGLGIDTSRVNNNSYYHYLTPKNYPSGISKIGSTNIANSGTWSATTFRSYFDPTASLFGDATATAVVISKDGNTVYVQIHYHSSVTNRLVTLPPEFTGKTISVIEYETASCLETGSTVPSVGIHVSTTGGYGYLILKLQ